MPIPLMSRRRAICHGLGLASLACLPNLAGAEPYSYLNSRIVEVANSWLGRTIGDGDCWDFVNEVFQRVGARRRGTYVWGEEIYHREVRGGILLDGSTVGYSIKAGDILQIYNARFEYPSGTVQTVRTQHTAVIIFVGTNDPNALAVCHQNSGGVRKVTNAVYNIRHLAAGKLYIYRPTT